MPGPRTEGSQTDEVPAPLESVEADVATRRHGAGMWGLSRAKQTAWSLQRNPPASVGRADCTQQRDSKGAGSVEKGCRGLLRTVLSRLQRGQAPLHKRLISRAMGTSEGSEGKQKREPVLVGWRDMAVPRGSEDHHGGQGDSFLPGSGQHQSRWAAISPRGPCTQAQGQAWPPG